MVEEYLTDDEQLEHVKRVIAENWAWVGGGILLGAALFFGYRYYEGYQNDRALRAAAQFSDMTTALEHNDRSQSRRAADALIKTYPTSPYADQAQLVIARLDIDDGQAANAVVPLTQVMNNSKDTELRHIARLRLARVATDQGKPDEAIRLLAEGSPGTFAARYHEVRGDAFYAKKDFKSAVAEYKAALNSDAGGADSALLQLKIVDLGESAAPVTAMVPGVAPTPAVKTPSTDSLKKAKP